MTNTHRLIIAFVLAVSAAAPLDAQKMFTRNAAVSFDATAPSSPETIKALNKSGTCVLDKSTGAVEMAVLIKGFLFERALMQEHFNENYLESDRYPKALFAGKLDNPAALDLSKDGTYKINVSGNLTMHGVSKPVTAPVTFTVKGGKASASVNFAVPLADYNIAIPSVVADKVSKSANIGISANLDPLK